MGQHDLTDCLRNESLLETINTPSFAFLYGTDNGLILAGSFVSVLPLLCLFLLLQREFISGLTSGAVKG